MRKLVLATSNRGKLAELQPLLGEAGFDLLTQGELGVADAIEDGRSFIENALIKARHAAAQTGLPALADDSGLLVDALDGAPGLITAHYAGVHGDSAGNIARLLRELEGVPAGRRGAHFYCVVVLLRHAGDPQPLVAEGRWPGQVLMAPQGAGGFGYDPVFQPDGQAVSAARMDPALKNRVSHRGQALARLRERLADAWPR